MLAMKTLLVMIDDENSNGFSGCNGKCRSGFGIGIIKN